MEQLININHHSTMEEKGRKIYKNNHHFRKLSNLMEHRYFKLG